MRHNKEKLIELSKPYFDQNKAIESLYITEDGHVFYKESLGYLKAHIQGKNLSFEEITRDEAFGKKEVQAPKENKTTDTADERELLLQKAIDLGLNPDRRTGIPKLKILIKEFNDDRE